VSIFWGGVSEKSKKLEHQIICILKQNSQLLTFIWRWQQFFRGVDIEKMKQLDPKIGTENPKTNLIVSLV